MSGLVIRFLTTTVVFLALMSWRVREHFPTLPNPLAFDLVLEPGAAGRADPLIVSGRTDAGDFLSVRFENERTIRFTYDSWGVPVISSQPVILSPGARLRLQVEMPALNQVQDGTAPPSDRVRVVCDGATVLDAAGHFFPRARGAIFFGENSLGGTACGPTLQGRIIAADGRELRGGPEKIFSRPARIADWLTLHPAQGIVIFLFSGWLVLGTTRIRSLSDSGRSAIRVVWTHRWFAGPAAAAVVVFSWLVTLGSFQFNHAEAFGSFYDYQAASLLQGRFDVPDEAIGGEAFESRGKLYGYFGPTPALLRMPFAIADLAFGKLSRAFMLLYFIASLLAAYLILQEAVRCASSPASVCAAPPFAEPSPFAIVTLVASVGLGSTLFFLGSRGLIYHEAIFAGIAFALWSCWAALRHLRAPERHGWVGAFVCALLSLHARPPTGLFALTFLGCVVLVHAAREWPRKIAPHAAVGALCFVAVLSLHGLAWLKFRTFEPAPLRLSRPFSEPGRLARIDGKTLHAANIPYNVYTYFTRPNFRIESGFPWLYLGSRHPPRGFPQAKIDVADHTLAIPFAMPSLFGLATLGSLGAALALPGTRVALVALGAGVLPMTLAMLAAIWTAQRYTGDFCPFLICAAAFGLVASDRIAPTWRTVLRVGIAGATLWSILITVAITIHYQGDYLWGVPDDVREDYRQLRRHVDAYFGRPTS